jgi:hypothetical protein
MEQPWDVACNCVGRSSSLHVLVYASVIFNYRTEQILASDASSVMAVEDIFSNTWSLDWMDCSTLFMYF